MADWLEEARNIYGDALDEEKVKRASEVDTAGGGRLTLPNPGEEVMVMFTRDPQKVESEKLKEQYGLDVTMFARVKKVYRNTETGTYYTGETEYDVPLGASLMFSLATNAERHGIKKESLVSKVFVVTANMGTGDREGQKMYRADYKPDVTGALTGVATGGQASSEVSL